MQSHNNGNNNNYYYYQTQQYKPVESGLSYDINLKEFSSDQFI